jgi:D-lactate dehydrogenase
VIDLRPELERILPPERILDRPIDVAAYASDASFYRLVPRAVLRPESIAEVREIFALSRRLRVPMTFRAAGTSLSGQAISDGLLVDVGHGWRGIDPLDGGKRVRVQPGAIGGKVNRALAAFGARIGPDPASIDACMMGGILSNNSSGMCCGVAQNSYHTLDSLVFVLPSGTVVDTSRPDAANEFERNEPGIAAGLIALRDDVRRQPALVERIRKKYRIKNTIGYSLNAFLDYDTPLEMLRHLLIGSEGTLAFLAEGVLHTVPDLPVKYTGLLFFRHIEVAAEAVVPLTLAGAAAIELMDRAALRSVQAMPGVPALLATLAPDAAGILVEFQSVAGTPIESLRAQGEAVAATLELVAPPEFTSDPAQQARLWKVRKGMFPAVGAVRKRGTSVIFEDIAVPPDVLAPAALDLQALFRKHRYEDGIIFGHAKDGNLHFVISQSFNDDAAIRQYEAFNLDLVEMVVGKYDGSLKAEHGTGRNMAPFVEAEWGGAAFEIMVRVKSLVDPDGLLNPGVLVNHDPAAHLKDLKSLPEVEEEVDKCIECGFCESLCPSRDLTLTPRQRIVVRRAMERPGADVASLREAYQYDALDTCATDGLCALACPVSIDTGRLTKRLRAAMASPSARRLAATAATHFSTTQRLVRTSLRASKLAGPLRRVAAGRIPGVAVDLPGPAGALPHTDAAGAAAILFASCVSRTMGTDPGETPEPSVPEAMIAVAARAGIRLHIPHGIDRHCCGMPFSSKGYREAQGIAANASIEFLWEASREGALPVLVDTSPCAYALTHADGLTGANRERSERMRLLDAVEFFRTSVLPALPVRRRASSVVVHPVCSLVKMGNAPHLTAMVGACSDRVFIPPSTGCCGFAGDRGYLVPELTEAATRIPAAEVRAVTADGHYSSSRTCEIGMSRATGRHYRSWIQLLAWASGD